jgi:hypothetical protein
MHVLTVGKQTRVVPNYYYQYLNARATLSRSVPILNGGPDARTHARTRARVLGGSPPYPPVATKRTVANPVMERRAH